jgi:hypothetical protein
MNDNHGDNRVIALNFALNVINGHNGELYDAMNLTRSIFLYLDGEDAILDTDPDYDFDDDNVVGLFRKSDPIQ